MVVERVEPVMLIRLDDLSVAHIILLPSQEPLEAILEYRL